MVTTKNNIKFHILEILHKNQVPVGANQIKRELASLYIDISEATVGRILIELDQEGLTEKQGYKGRILTKQGIEQLEQMRIKLERMEYGEEFFKVLDNMSEKELVDLLVARRLIESYLARLAAQNITPDILEEMKSVIDLQARRSKKGIAAEYDVLFHKLIANAAGNKVLDAMLDLIRNDSQLTPALEYIRKKVKSKIMVDHQKILDAIINKDPDAAEQAMTEHINSLITDVHLYWSQSFE